MSCYLCNPEHVGLVAAMTAQVSYGVSATELALEMASLNLLAAAEKYPSDVSGTRPGPAGISDTDFLKESVECAAKYAQGDGSNVPEGFGIPELRAMAKCYQYQASDYGNYKLFRAYHLMEEVSKMDGGGRKSLVDWEYNP